MIESKISNSHHYYLSLIKTKSIDNCKSILLKLNNIQFEDISQVGHDCFHIQKEMRGLYGSFELLSKNLSKQTNDSIFYWYDFYLGQINIRNYKLFYLCFPYKKFEDKLLEEFNALFDDFECYHVIDINQLLEEFRTKNKVSDLLSQQYKNIDVNITNYSANIVEDTEADSLKIIGKDPLRSIVFDYLFNHEEIEIKTSSIKLLISNLSCKTEIILNCDYHDNIRFWLPSERINSNRSENDTADKYKTLGMIEESLNFIAELGVINTKTTKSKYSEFETNDV